MCQKWRSELDRKIDVAYVTEEWKMEIRNKRKYAQLFAQIQKTGS